MNKTFLSFDHGFHFHQDFLIFLESKLTENSATSWFSDELRIFISILEIDFKKWFIWVWLMSTSESRPSLVKSRGIAGSSFFRIQEVSTGVFSFLCGTKQSFQWPVSKISLYPAKKLLSRLLKMPSYNKKPHQKRVSQPPLVTLIWDNIFVGQPYYSRKFEWIFKNIFNIEQFHWIPHEKWWSLTPNMSEFC